MVNSTSIRFIMCTGNMRLVFYLCWITDAFFNILYPIVRVFSFSTSTRCNCRRFVIRFLQNFIRVKSDNKNNIQQLELIVLTDLVTSLISLAIIPNTLRTIERKLMKNYSTENMMQTITLDWSNTELLFIRYWNLRCFVKVQFSFTYFQALRIKN